MSYSKLGSNLILRSFMVFAKTVSTFLNDLNLGDGLSGPPCIIAIFFEKIAEFCPNFS